jgi:transcriptional regulator with XRE-family HTH domain
VPKDTARDAVAANVIRLLREERQKRALSMTVVAQRAGLSRSMISLVERDLRNPSLDTLLRITEALDLDLAATIARATKLADQRAPGCPLKRHRSTPASRRSAPRSISPDSFP